MHLISSPFDKFFKRLSSGGMLLMLVTLIALVWANSPIKDYYHFVWHHHLSFSLAPYELSLSLLHWINDGLMVLFFFVVGLEIKREFLAGELSSFRQAIFPVFAAVGGMVVPILFFFSFGLTGDANQGWGIPMATDIAFSLAILSMMGSRVPLSLKVFLTALAIVDDLGAILVIALFYSSHIYWHYLFIAFILLSILAVANYYDIQIISLYIGLGIIIWFLFLQSGIHPTIAGVLVALTIPARNRVNIKYFSPKIKWRLKKFSSLPGNAHSCILTTEQLHAIDDLENIVERVQSPLQKMEHRLSGMVNYLILPLFALSNAGVTILATAAPLSSIADALTPLSLIIAISLIFGKSIGISLFSWLAVKLKLAVKPRNIPWMAFVGLGLIGGIGFTMSLFIANLAFEAPDLQDQAKIGIFIGSFISGLAGYLLLKRALSPNKKKKKTGQAPFFKRLIRNKTIEQKVEKQQNFQ